MFFDKILVMPYTIGNNTFTNWTANKGGAIYNNLKDLNLYDNFFYNNSANNEIDDDAESILSTGDGGAIYNECPTDTP